MRILLAWELGDHLGHAAQLVSLGEALADRGADVYLALQNCVAAAPFLRDKRLKIVPAPYGRVTPKPRPKSEAYKPLSFAGELRSAGYDDPKELAMLIKGWDSVFDLVKPDLFVAMSAPTALLAAQSRMFIKVRSGTGFDLPPRSKPMPPLHFWENADFDAIEQQEQKILGIINDAQEILGRIKFTAFQDILKTDHEYLTTIAELDHYPDRIGGLYTGPLFPDDRGLEVTWLPDEDGSARKRIFAYLYPDRKAFPLVLNALRSMVAQDKTAYDIVLVAPHLHDGLIARFSAPSLRIYANVVQTRWLADRADLAISHGGSSLAAQFLLKGVPLALFPTALDQQMLARRVETLKLGKAGHAEMSPAETKQLLATLLADLATKSRAQAFARRHAALRPEYHAGFYADNLIGLVLAAAV